MKADVETTRDMRVHNAAVEIFDTMTLGQMDTASASEIDTWLANHLGPDCPLRKFIIQPETKSNE